MKNQLIEAFKQGIITRFELRFVNSQNSSQAANFQLKHQITIQTNGEIYWTPTTNTGYLTMALSGCY